MKEKIVNWASLLLAIISVIPTIIGFVKKNPIVAYICLSISILMAIIFILSLFFRHNIKFYRWLMFKFTRKPYIVLNRIITYECKEGKKYKYSKELEIQSVNNNGLKHYDDKFSWSGNFRGEIVPINRLQTVSNRTRMNGWEKFTINFPYSLNKKEKVQTGIILDELLDDENIALNFLSANIYEPVKHLELIVIFSNKIPVQKVECRVFDNFHSDIHCEYIDMTTSLKDNKVCYRIEYPIKGYRYQISWEYKELD